MDSLRTYPDKGKDHMKDENKENRGLGLTNSSRYDPKSKLTKIGIRDGPIGKIKIIEVLREISVNLVAKDNIKARDFETAMQKGQEQKELKCESARVKPEKRGFPPTPEPNSGTDGRQSKLLKRRLDEGLALREDCSDDGKYNKRAKGELEGEALPILLAEVAKQPRRCQ